VSSEVVDKKGPHSVLTLSEKELYGRVFMFSETGVPLTRKILKSKIGSVVQNGVK
jgi:hypothetical protein